ncbi:hypothetical protein ABLN72_05255, partial [Mycobacterium tuberculosis]
LDSVIDAGVLTYKHPNTSTVFAFIVKRFRVFRAPLQSQHFHCFHIYRETLSRFRAPLISSGCT